MMRRLGSDERYNPPPSRAPTVCSEATYSSGVGADLRTVPSEIDFPSLNPDDFTNNQQSILHPTESRESNDSGNSNESSPSSQDSGFAENNILVDKEELGAKSAHLCTNLKTIVCLAYDFWRDVNSQTEKPKDLLDELEGKMSPFLVSLDEEMTGQEETIRRSLDRSSITDPRLTWLLEYNKCQKQMRATLDALTGSVCPDLDRVLRLRDRGCQGLETRETTGQLLKNMVGSMRLVDSAIERERANKESAASRAH